MTTEDKGKLSRRTVLKGTLAAGAAAASSAFPLANIARAESRSIKIGLIQSYSGVRANFSEPDPYVLGKVQALLKNGLKVGKSTYTVEIVKQDNQSSIAGTAPVANNLLMRQNVDLLLIADGDGAVASGEVADSIGTPTISTMTPWEGWFFTRKGNPAVGFPWTFHFMWGAGDITKNFAGMWNQVKGAGLNPNVGTLYFDIAAGRAFADPQRGMPPGLAAAGYKEIQGGFFKPETDDFSNQISMFKNAGAQIASGFVFAPHWQIFWTQAAQAGFKPEICSIAGAFLFPSAIDSLAGRGDGMSTEVWWTPNFPFRSTLTGQSAKELAADYEKETGKQWTQPLGMLHALWDVGLGALQAVDDPKDRNAVRDAIRTMNRETVAGPINWKDAPVKSVAFTPLLGGQWRKTSGGKFKNDLKIVYNGTAPNIPVEDSLKLLSKLA
jgi:branched-chain amino acid transport system substrate-binding protein